MTLVPQRASLLNVYHYDRMPTIQENGRVVMQRIDISSDGNGRRMRERCSLEIVAGLADIGAGGISIRCNPDGGPWLYIRIDPGAGTVVAERESSDDTIRRYATWMPVLRGAVFAFKSSHALEHLHAGGPDAYTVGTHNHAEGDLYDLSLLWIVVPPFDGWGYPPAA